MSLVFGGQATKQVEGKSRVVNNTYWEEIAEQEIPDHDLVRIIGSHEAIGTTELILSELSAGQQFYLGVADEVVATSDSNEDSAAQTGALTLEVTGLTDTAGVWAVDTDTITLAGAPGTGTTTKKFIRVFSVRAVTAGSVGANVGTITFTDQGATGTFMEMTPGHGKTSAALYTVPSTKKLLIRNFWGTASAGKSVELHMYTRAEGEAWNRFCQLSLNNSNFDTNILLNSLAAKTDIELRVETTTGTAGACSGGWTGRTENA